VQLPPRLSCSYWSVAGDCGDRVDDLEKAHANPNVAGVEFESETLGYGEIQAQRIADGGSVLI
jgi:hypothetical protein